ncbi:hypothetical protein BH11BAC1_BH11BAC1_04140 [soil metagenome]
MQINNIFTVEMRGIYQILVFYIFYSMLVQPVFAQVYNYYYGNIHAHSGYSDGNQAANASYNSAKKCFQYAAQSLHTNYFGISDHNHSMAGMLKPDYQKGRLESDSVNQDNIFTTLYGMEYGVINNGGHVIVYGIDSLIGWEAGNYDIFNSEYDYNSLFNMIAGRQNAFAYLAHMNATDYGNLLGQPYNATWDQAIVGLAMKNGPAFSTDTTYSNPSTTTYNTRFQDLLKKGYHVSVGIDQDSHYITFDRSSQGRTVVLATSLTRTNMIDAFRNRRFYASEDWNAQADFRVNNHLMGSIFTDINNPTINILITDPDVEAVSSIKIWFGIPGSGTTATVLTSNFNSSTLNFTHSISTGSTYYYYAEITQADGNKIWTAPVWVTKISSPLPVELIHFSATREEQSVLLSWITASEINNDHFNVLRGETNNDFTEICQLDGSGNTSTMRSYSVLDNEPLRGINYYRLDQVDIDGTVNQLKTVALNFSDRIFDVTFFPNPVSGSHISFGVQTVLKGSIQVEIYSSFGELVYTGNEALEKGFNSLVIDGKHFHSGIYMYKITDTISGEVMTGKIEIENF